MTDEMLNKAVNDAWMGMEHAQMLRDYAQTEWMRKIADSLYHAHWTGYYLLLEIRKQMKKERTEGSVMLRAETDGGCKDGKNG